MAAKSVKVKGYCVKGYTRKSPSKKNKTTLKKPTKPKQTKSIRSDSLFQSDKAKIANKISKRKKVGVYAVHKYGKNDFRMGRSGKIIKSGFKSYYEARNYMQDIMTPVEEKQQKASAKYPELRLYEVISSEKIVITNMDKVNEIMKMQDQSKFYKKYGIPPY